MKKKTKCKYRGVRGRCDHVKHNTAYKAPGQITMPYVENGCPYYSAVDEE